MVTLNFLPEKYLLSLAKIDILSLSELRFRVGFPVKGIIKGVKIYLSDNGATFDKRLSIICGQEDIDHIVNFVTERSLYAFNDRLKRGFITTKDGVRIGIAGECVFDGVNITTIKKITSLNVRIPHEIKNCSAKIFDMIFLKETYNTLIISPPSKGKTTILKDLARKLNDYTSNSILIVDERGEFVGVSGENIDTVKFSDKCYAFNYAIRSLSPDVIITDELQTEDDWDGAEYATTCGVKIIASCHGTGIDDLKNKKYFKENIFERYVVLDAKKPAGSVKSIFDKRFVKL